MNKYRNRKVVVNGITFDSRREADRYRELQIMQKAGEISNLELQKEYELIPVQREPDTIGPKGGTYKGALIERKCSYIADFVYFDNFTGKTVVEDAKGLRTSDYLIKRKLMLWVHGIRIQEV